jgi:GT2 family glycosyltransferase
MRAARNEIVLFTDDDCRVSETWAATAWALMRDINGRMVGGRVIALGNPARVPTVKDRPVPEEHIGVVRFDAVCSSNMVVNRSAVLEMGGFDEALLAAEDIDLGYRWSKAGNTISYRPELVVWHTDWRTDKELQQVNLAYAYGGGMFHAKHLRRGDLGVLRSVLCDVGLAVRDLARSLRDPRRVGWRNHWQGFTRGYVPGLLAGWRTFDRDGSSRGSTQPDDV